MKVQTHRHILVKPVMIDYKKQGERKARRGSLDLVSVLKPEFIKSVDKHLDAKVNDSDGKFDQDEYEENKEQVISTQRVEMMLSGDKNLFIFGKSGEFNDSKQVASMLKS